MSRALLPAWLVQHITERTGQEPGGRYARRVRCRHCQALVLQGVDDDWAATIVLTDWEPLTPLGEFLARLARRGTYALRRRTGHRLELTRRDHWQIKGSPAGTKTAGALGYVVVAEHACREVGR